MADQDSNRVHFEGSMISVEKGQWVWNEESGELMFQSNPKSKPSRSKPRPAAMNRTRNDLKLQSVSSSKIMITDDDVVSLEDVKVIAVELINKVLVESTRKSTCKIFDSCFSSEQMDNFLWSTLIYFNDFLDHKRAVSDENVSVHGSIGEEARKTLKMCKEKLAQSKVNLGEVYSKFILGLGHKESHHCHAGRLKVSKTRTDKEFFEVVYEFMMYAVWITFGYRDWEIIHEEMGRFFRTTQFNRDFNITASGKDVSSVHVEGLGALEKKSDEYLSYKVHYDRPFVGMLNELHSAAHVSYLPQPKDRTETECLLPTQLSPPARLGIIGDKLKNYDLNTLRSLETDSEGDSENDNTSSDSGSESVVSGIIEDEGESDDLF